MSRFTKPFAIILSCLIVLQLFSLGFIILVPEAIGAEFTITSPAGKQYTMEELKIVIPFDTLSNVMKLTDEDFVPCHSGSGGVSYKDGEIDTTAKSGERLCLKIDWIGQYIGAAYRYGVVLGSILAVLSLMFGGVLYMIGGMNQAMITKAKGFMGGSVMGLVLLLGSFVMLNSINPNLIELKPVEVEIVKAGVAIPDYCEDLVKETDMAEKVIIQKKFYDDSITCANEYDVTVKPEFAMEFNVPAGQKCKGKTCPGRGACTNKVTGKYECVDAYIYGRIKADMPGILKYAKMSGVDISKTPFEGLTAYLDYIKLYESEVHGYDNEMAKAKFTAGDDQYLIVAQGDMDFIQENSYLQIEVNDQALGWTNDDKYILGLDRKVPSGDDPERGKGYHGVPIGIDGSICCTYSCIPGKEAEFKIEAGCNSMIKYDLNHTTLEVDIDTADLYCGNTPLAESFGPVKEDKPILKDSNGVPVEGRMGSKFIYKSGMAHVAYNVDECSDAVPTGSLQVGQECGKNADCRSNDCEAETVMGVTTQRCECNNDDHCDHIANTYCSKSVWIWNTCSFSKFPGITGDPNKADTKKVSEIGSYVPPQKCTSPDECYKGSKCINGDCSCVADNGHESCVWDIHDSSMTEVIGKVDGFCSQVVGDVGCSELQYCWTGGNNDHFVKAGEHCAFDSQCISGHCLTPDEAYGNNACNTCASVQKLGDLCSVNGDTDTCPPPLLCAKLVVDDYLPQYRCVPGPTTCSSDCIYYEDEGYNKDEANCLDAGGGQNACDCDSYSEWAGDCENGYICMENVSKKYNGIDVCVDPIDPKANYGLKGL
ncbi:hypothetical protein HQ571_01735 [Candidatus Kuenenbacteria bacterium]|nr:hypothetical protein [Candidatus Kuenenbacteria bacterium]